jgi:hypothetical protein
MNVRRLALIIGVLIVILFAFGGTAQAQDKPHNGFAMGYPAAAGILWNISDTVALWPELIDVRHASTTSNGLQNDNNAIGAGMRVLLYLAPVQAFRPYIVPQFDYTRQNSTSTATSATSTATALVTTTTSTYSGAASFGVQYALSARFGVFGEVGFEYDHETGTGLIASHGNTTGTRNAVGVIVYFP